MSINTNILSITKFTTNYTKLNKDLKKMNYLSQQSQIKYKMLNKKTLYCTSIKIRNRPKTSKVM